MIVSYNKQFERYKWLLDPQLLNSQGKNSNDYGMQNAIMSWYFSMVLISKSQN